MFEAVRLGADILPSQAKQDAVALPKRDRRLTLTKIDKRGRLGKRVAELTAIFAAAVGGELTAMRKLKIEKAADLTAMAEQARGDFMRDGKGTLDDIVRLERKADQAAGRWASACFESESQSMATYLFELMSKRNANVIKPNVIRLEESPSENAAPNDDAFVETIATTVASALRGNAKLGADGAVVTPERQAALWQIWARARELLAAGS
jgi:hypothetical protein